MKETKEKILFSRRPFIVAGPCSVENKEQLQRVTEDLCRIQTVQMIRGGVWKPRSRPGGFEGLGEPALQWMKEIQESTLRMADGRAVRFCCEVARPEHVALCQQYGIENIWLGARTTANPFMVEEICESLRGSNLMVMVKNPVSPDVKLWLGAIERVEKAGITKIAAIHRGFNMYDNHGYRNEPLWEIPMELRRLRPTLPILCDPSHIGGRADMVEPLSHKAMRLDYDGLIIEAHPSPSDALTDAPQQLTPADLQHLLATLPPPSANSTENPGIERLRKEIDDIDHECLRLLKRRMTTSQRIATIKEELQMSVYQPKRWDEVMNDRLALATKLGLNADFVKELMEKIHAESVRVQIDQ